MKVQNQMKWLSSLLAIVVSLLVLSNCISSGPVVDITVLQVHLDDSLSIQAGKYDSIQIDLVDKDGKVWKAAVFSGPYDRDRDKAKLESIQVGQGAPGPISVVISAFKGKEKQAEFRFRVADQKATVEVSTFVPPVKVPVDTTKPKDTVAIPGRITLAPKSLTLFEGGDSSLLAVTRSGSDSAQEVKFRSTNEEVVVATAGGGLFPMKAGNAMVIAFLVGSPMTGDTATVTVKKDPPVIDAGTDRKVILDSSVTFNVKVTQEYGSVRILKWDLDGDGTYEDSAAKSAMELKHAYKTKGDFTVKFYAKDTEGNETIKQLRIQAGILTPFVVITKPGSDTLVNVPSIEIEYTVDGVRKTKISTLTEGRNIVPVVESNSYGTGGDTILITRDTDAPGRPVFSAQLPATSTSRRPTWTWTSNPADKGNGVFKIKLDGKEVKEGSLLTWKPDADLIDGAHFLEVQERDSAGNWSDFVSHTIYVDLTPPSVKIELPSTLPKLGTSETSILLAGSVSEAGGVAIVKYQWGSNQGVAEGGEKWKTAAITLTDNASTTIIVSATDKAGNGGSDTLVVYCDRKGPGITIASPSEIGNLFTTASKHKVKGTASDTSTVKLVTYQLTGATTGEGDAVGTKDWSIPEITLRPGVTQLLVTAYDSLMNPNGILLDFNYKANVTLVNASATGGNNGTTWKDAYQDMQTALSKASIGEVWVAKGTYKPTTGQDRTATFQMQSGVHLYGGFKGGETAREDRSISDNLTILSGDIGAAVATDNAYHVVTGASHGSLDGFTITGGYADDPAGEDKARGGGIFANSASPNIVNCTFKNNYAIAGGAFYLNTGFSQVTNSIFVDNKARDDGGAIRIVGNSTPLIVNSLFARNTTTNTGGAVSNEEGLLNIKNTLFSENSAPYGNNVSTVGMLNVYNANADTTWEGGLTTMNGPNQIYMYGKKGAWVPQYQGTNDFRLKPGSPGIDEGMNDQDIPKFDITGAERPKGKQIDIGPYEQ